MKDTKNNTKLFFIYVQNKKKRKRESEGERERRSSPMKVIKCIGALLCPKILLQRTGKRGEAGLIIS